MRCYGNVECSEKDFFDIINLIFTPLFRKYHKTIRYRQFILFHLLLIGGNILKLRWDGGVLVSLAVARALEPDKMIRYGQFIIF